MSYIHLLDEMVEFQEKKLLAIAREINDRITSDDVLQPNDFDQLEHNPFFRYEEGVLKGIHSVRMAILALEKEQLTGSSPFSNNCL